MADVDDATGYLRDAELSFTSEGLLKWSIPMPYGVTVLVTEDLLISMRDAGNVRAAQILAAEGN